MKYEITIYGNPVLREQSEPVSEFNEELAKLGRDMLETMYDANGIGLAAQQIGLTKSICVIDIPEEADMDEEGNRNNPTALMPLILVNPKVSMVGDEKGPFEEGCLSFPEIHGKVSRPLTCTVQYQDETGVRHSIEARGLLARALQHEIDHLNGVLFIDYMSVVKLTALRGRLKRLQAEA